MPQKTLILAAALALAAAGTSAQTIWRCGNSYSTQPCSGGSSFEAPPAPSQAEAARAEKATRADAERAAALEKARLTQEKNAPKAIVIAPAEPVPRPQAQEPKKKGKGKGKPEVFTASVPGSGKKK